MKYRVHIWEELHVSYETVADSKAEAVQNIIRGENITYESRGERTGDRSSEILVDPILESGEEDWDNIEWFSEAQ